MKNNRLKAWSKLIGILCSFGYNKSKESGILGVNQPILRGLACPNCLRPLPNKKFRRKWGCKYCIPKKTTGYCNGKY